MFHFADSDSSYVHNLKRSVREAGIVSAYWYQEIFTATILLGENELC